MIKILIKILIILFIFNLPVYPLNYKILLGIDVLEKENFSILKNKKVGLVTNHTGRNTKKESTIDILYKNVNLVALFSPEHGIRGTEDREGIESSIDTKTGLPIYSLYGDHKRPKKEWLENIDVLVFDIQDIGSRFYTYITTMGYCMEECAKYKKEFVVLDRPNPINGLIVEGEVLESKYKHFSGYYCIPIRHGMTVGEIAAFHKNDLNLDLKLTIIRMEQWKRNMWFDQTGIEWINTSPNMRNLRAATLYPGIGCFESTNISVGRGTNIPFEIIGAPWINSDLLLKEIRKLNLPGIKFEKTKFTPKASLYKDQECHGLKLIITDREKLRSTEVFIYLISILRNLFPDNFEYKISKMTGSDLIKEMLEKNKSPESIIKIIREKCKKFYDLRKIFLLY